MNLLSNKKNSDFVILITDDDPSTLGLLKRVLEKEGYQVTTASDALSTREVLNSSKIDLLLLDIYLPGETGYNLCKELRKQKQFELLPIIFISAIEKEVMMEGSVLVGGDDFIVKPIDIKELKAKIKAFCRIKSLQDFIVDQNYQYQMEFKMARKVQELMIPIKELLWNGIHIKTFFQPYIQIGGDYVDVIPFKDQLHIVIADSIGHGPSAALLSAMFKMQLYSLPADLDLKSRIDTIRANLVKAIPENYSITFFYGIVYKDNLLEYSNGGNPYPLLYHNNHITQLKGKSPLILDIKLSTETNIECLQIHSGSILLLYTDGLTEATNSDMEMVDTKGLAGILRKTANLEGDIIENIMTEVHLFCGDNPPNDDIAMISVRFP